MANNVFANMMELSCKAGAGKSICCFPDVCMTPPENPATPPGVPVPYPNTGMASDSTSGSRSVKISGKEVSLKNKSYFKKSMGDEAGCAAKKGVVSSVNRGKVYFTKWSMDVKIEGENAVRNLDLTTHNHASTMNTGPWPFVDTLDPNGLPPPGHPCNGVTVELKLTPYKDGCPEKHNGDKPTPHHLIPDRCLRKGGSKKNTKFHGRSPCICVMGKSQHKEDHKKAHEFFDPIERWHFENGEDFTYERARYAAGLSAVPALDPNRELTDKEVSCVEAQLDNFYKDDDNGPKLKDGDSMTTSGAPGKVNDLYEMVEDKFG
jgi:hypothetical protein